VGDRALGRRRTVAGGIVMRTFLADTTKIDVIAHISGDDLGIDRLVLRRFEGSETTANAAFQKLVARYCGRPLAEYAVARRRSLSADLLSGKRGPRRPPFPARGRNLSSLEGGLSALATFLVVIKS
jgi:hypothetical protein